jgi:N6-adenosine-specific RNA methylase IME4
MKFQTHKVAEIFPGMNVEDYDRLKADIAQKGQLQPITVTTDGRIIDGRHRYRAMVELGRLDELEYSEVPDDLPINEMTDIVTSLNLCRRHMTTGQRAVIGARVQGVLEQWEKENPDEAKINLKGERRKIAGDMVGVTGHTIQQAKKVLDQGVKELLDLVEQGKVAVSDAQRVAKLAEPEQREVLAHHEKTGTKTLAQSATVIQREKQARAIASAPVPKGTYTVVVADPPWSFDKRKADESHRGRTPYPTMTVEEIKRYPCPAAADAVLWLWTTNAHMHDAFHVLEAWGFQQKTILTWAKPRIGTGDWLRGQTEHCLLAVRGKAKTLSPEGRSTLLAAPTKAHSVKPDAFFELVEAITPGATRCELFSRAERPGWDCFGAEMPPAVPSETFVMGSVL